MHRACGQPSLDRRLVTHVLLAALWLSISTGLVSLRTAVAAPLEAGSSRPADLENRTLSDILAALGKVFGAEIVLATPEWKDAQVNPEARGRALEAALKALLGGYNHYTTRDGRGNRVIHVLGVVREAPRAPVRVRAASGAGVAPGRERADPQMPQASSVTPPGGWPPIPEGLEESATAPVATPSGGDLPVPPTLFLPGQLPTKAE